MIYDSIDDEATRHVTPAVDFIEHDTTTDQPDCVCGPHVEHVPNPHGRDGWIIHHHRLSLGPPRQ